jgi:glycosyltransferase involved in cell wall biosynthesis
MENTIDLSVILPIKSAMARDFDEYFDRSILSLKSQKVGFSELVIVHTMEEILVKKLTDYDFGDLTVKLVAFEGEANFQSQTNLGIENSSSKWVSFFEFDDEYANIWFENVGKYMTHYPEIDAFLPIVVDVDEKGMFIGFTNEATFAANFTQEMGFLTNETLLNYQNFQTSGMVIKKEKLEEFGFMKPSMKLTFVYEFLLRMTYNSMRIMTIPKLGYKHTTLREGSIFWNYKNGSDVMTENEVKFWISTAKKEYFFNEDRNIKYELENA